VRQRRIGVLWVGLASVLLAGCGLKVPVPETVAGEFAASQSSGDASNQGADVAAAQAGAGAAAGAGVGAQAQTAAQQQKKAAQAATTARGLFANNTEGLTDTSIKICAHIPITGAAAVDRNPNRFGKFYWDWVNSQGGVYGRKVDYIAYDDRYNPPFAVQAAERCRSQGAFVIAGAAGTDQLVAVAKWAARNKVPYLMGPASVKDTGQYVPYAKMIGPDYEYQSELLADYLFKQFGKDVNYAMVRMDSPFFQAAHDAFVNRLKTHGIALKVDEKVQKDESTFTGLMARLSAADVKVVNNFTTPVHWLKMMKQRPATYQPTWTAISPAAGFNLVAEILTGEGDQAQAGNALVFHHFNPAYPATRTDNVDDVINQYPYAAEIRKFQEIFNKYATQEEKAPRDDIDWSAYLASKNLHRILLKVGKDLTRTKLWQFLDTYKETAQEAAPGCPADFTRKPHEGAWFVNVFKLGTRQWENVKTCVDATGLAAG
jgi:ABC-type branched-subunit amino acid transport system substrate-binding protein